MLCITVSFNLVSVLLSECKLHYKSGLTLHPFVPNICIIFIEREIVPDQADKDNFIQDYCNKRERPLNKGKRMNSIPPKQRWKSGKVLKDTLGRGVQSMN